MNKNAVEQLDMSRFGGSAPQLRDAQRHDADDNVGAGAEVGWRVAHYD